MGKSMWDILKTSGVAVHQVWVFIAPAEVTTQSRAPRRRQKEEEQRDGQQHDAMTASRESTAESETVVQDSACGDYGRGTRSLWYTHTVSIKCILCRDCIQMSRIFAVQLKCLSEAFNRLKTICDSVSFLFFTLTHAITQIQESRAELTVFQSLPKEN